MATEKTVSLQVTIKQLEILEYGLYNVIMGHKPEHVELLNILNKAHLELLNKLAK